MNWWSDFPEQQAHPLSRAGRILRGIAPWLAALVVTFLIGGLAAANF